MTLTAKPEFRRIAVDLQIPVVRITLNHPPLNVMDMEMMGELVAALEQIEAIPEISTIVFAGSERAFSAGVDIAAHAPESVRNMLTAFHSVIRAVVATKKLTIASVRRHCLGGGAELALMCDVVYATPDSVLGFPEIKLACFPPVASVALASVVGQKLAAEMILDRAHSERPGSAGCRAGERTGRRSGDAGAGVPGAGFAVESGGDWRSRRRRSTRGIRFTSTRAWRALSRFISTS